MLQDAVRAAGHGQGVAPARRAFLSYNSKDMALARRVAEGLRERDGPELFFAPEQLKAGELWLPRLAEEIAAADAFLLLVGAAGLGPWQVQEYYAALDRRVKAPDFPLLVLLLDGCPAPGLPFLNQMHWIVAADPADAASLGEVLAGLAGQDGRPSELWRHTAPYRGLAAMTETDSAFFFGRAAETEAVLRCLAERPDRLALLIGNSGVGKSSVAQAGVIAALKRQSLPGEAAGDGTRESVRPWPPRFRDSRSWVYLAMQPGRGPLQGLVDAFLRAWGLDPRDAGAHTRRAEWAAALSSGTLGLPHLIDATVEHLAADGEGRPSGFFLYVDQGEELYAQGEETERRRFSAVLAGALSDPRLHAVMSLRADFFGQLQADAALYAAHDQVNVVPLGAAALREVVARPAALLGARFEDPQLASSLAGRAEAESARDAGALPLLSYLLDDMWSAMVARGDGTLRLPSAAVELGGVLAERAEAYIGTHPEDAEPLRRILTLKLATVREDGEPTRRRALRHEFSEAEWRIVGLLADHPNRLLVVTALEGREPQAEVAHEAIFRHWARLRGWIAGEREFLVFKARLEGDRQRWQAMPPEGRDDALLRGIELAEAEAQLSARAEDLEPEERAFIAAGTTLERARRDQEQAERVGRARLKNALLSLAVLAVVILSAIAWWGDGQRREAERQTATALTSTAEAQRQAGRAQDREQEAERAKREADRQRVEAETERAIAERTVRAAKRAANDMIFKLAQRFKGSGAPTPLIRAVLEPAEALVLALVASAPDDRELLRLQSVMDNEFGDVLRTVGDNDGAFARYEHGLVIAERLFRARPSDNLLVRDVWVSLNRVGDMLLVRGDRDAALVRFERSLAIAERLSTGSPANAGFARDVSISLNKIGDVLRARGDIDGALARYESSLVIRERLAAAEPGNVEWARNLAVNLERIGDVLMSRGDRDGAQARYERSLAIWERLSKAEPTNADLARGTTVPLERIGDVLLARGDREGALAYYERGLAIRERLSAVDPSDAGLARDTALTHRKIALVDRRLGRTAEACQHLATGRAILLPFRARSGISKVIVDELAWLDDQLKTCPAAQ